MRKYATFLKYDLNAKPKILKNDEMCNFIKYDFIIQWNNAMLMQINDKSITFVILWLFHEISQERLNNHIMR